MGDDQKSTQESTRDMLRSLSEYGPESIRAIADTTPYTARKQYEVDKEMYPQYYELDRQNQLAGSQNELDIATGTGQKLAEQAGKLQETVDPEFYKSRSIVGEAINKFLGGYDPNNLSPTELAQIQRGLGAQDGQMAPSAMNTIKNAQTFGNAATERWKNFGNAIGIASSALPALKTGFSGFEVATRRALSPLPANSTQAMNTNFGFANNALSEIGQNQRLAESKKKDAFDQLESLSRTSANSTSAVSGFM